MCVDMLVGKRVVSGSLEHMRRNTERNDSGKCGAMYISESLIPVDTSL